ncbi:MAG: hypothetical protein WDW38_009636 [Sanguina aurantia]
MPAQPAEACEMALDTPSTHRLCAHRSTHEPSISIVRCRCGSVPALSKDSPFPSSGNSGSIAAQGVQACESELRGNAVGGGCPSDIHVAPTVPRAEQHEPYSGLKMLAIGGNVLDLGAEGSRRWTEGGRTF